MLPSTFVPYATYRYGWDTTTVGLTLALVGVCAMVVQGAGRGRRGDPGADDATCRARSVWQLQGATNSVNSIAQMLGPFLFTAEAKWLSGFSLAATFDGESRTSP
jgi:hypothetical protein